MELSSHDVKLIKGSIPMLEHSGEEIAKKMYEIMLENYPVVTPLFEGINLNNQFKKLANIILAYAKNIDNPQELEISIDKIADTHVYKGIKPEHYPIVGNCLLMSMIEVTGIGLTSPIIEAWGKAYLALSESLIEKERKKAVSAISETG